MHEAAADRHNHLQEAPGMQTQRRAGRAGALAAPRGPAGLTPFPRGQVCARGIPKGLLLPQLRQDAGAAVQSGSGPARTAPRPGGSGRPRPRPRRGLTDLTSGPSCSRCSSSTSGRSRLTSRWMKTRLSCTSAQGRRAKSSVSVSHMRSPVSW